MPSFDRDPYERRRYALRLLILALFLVWILIGHFAHAAVTVTPDSPPNWNPMGSSGGSAELAELMKQPVGTGRAGYPPVPISKKESVPASVAKPALRGVMRAAGWIAWGLIIAELGGEFLNWLQCETNQICKPGQDSRNLGPYTRKYRMNISGCPSSTFYNVDGCWTSSREIACNTRGVYINGWSYYPTSNDNAGAAPCYGYRASDNIVTQLSSIGYMDVVAYCNAPAVYQSGVCVMNSQPVPVSDTDLDNAAQALITQKPASAIDALRKSGAWDNLATKRVSPEQSNVQGNPVTTTTADGKTKTVTPGTKAKEQPAPAGSTSNSTVVYNYNTTTVTNADGTQQTTVTEEDAGISDLELPDDYARENTLQEMRDALVSKPDAAPKPETATQPKQAVQTYFDMLKTVPIVDTIGGGLDRWENDFDGGGSCPTYDIPVYGVIRTMTSHCIVGEAIRDFLATVLAVIYSVAAVRIFLSA